MYFLIYVSSAKKLMTQEELKELLDFACEQNDIHGITGLLLYENGNFMQMIEGDKSEVLALFDNIKADERHHDIYVVTKGESESRQFKGWSMGFKQINSISDGLSFEQYVKRQVSGVEAERIRRYIESFYEHNL